MYVFIPSYPSIFFALYLSTIYENTVVVTNNKSVRDLLDNLDVNYLYYDSRPSFKRILLHKYKLSRVLKSISGNADFYLLDNAFTLDGFYFAAHWKIGRVFHCNLSIDYEEAQEKISISKCIKKRIVELILGLKMIFRMKGDELIYGINQNFIKDHKILPLVLPMPYPEMIKEIIKQFQVKEKRTDFLWIGQGQMKNIIQFETLEKMLKQLLEKYQFAIKEHPMHETVNEICPSCYCYPKYIPSEFLFNNISRAVCSVYSYTLVYACNFDHLKAVSLLELVEWSDEKFKNKVKKLLIQDSNNKILFPQTIAELLAIINE